ncbi:hypothetical protein VN97_g4048 [Penicillium thymicola]|uniref:Uncharacterized protein n=1 Tax=Penicillium thymicola TaxID=293382 RepID=A0AAI9TL79_PENTH|nr:hypothetical protein VN97_g4048 [Penicillium thymicola]
MPDKSLLEPTFRCEHTDPEEGWRFSRSVCSALLATSSRRSFFKTRMSHVKILNNVHRADMSGSKNPGSNRRTFHGRHTVSILQSSAMMPVSLNNQLFPRFSIDISGFFGLF